MRALSGAIITAGALIGLGLTAVGYGLRYQGFNETLNPNTNEIYGAPSLAIIEVTLLISLAVGLGVAFLGLAFHHYRRHQEMLRFNSPTDTSIAA
jgi:hypothetical protein